MIAILLTLAAALTPIQAYNQGNALYAHKDYAGAAAAYERALAAGPSAAAHYNLGNALFKAGQVGRAILNYRRARMIAPRDPDIAGNLEFARAYRVDKQATASSPIARVLDAVFRRLSRREAAVAAAACFALAALALATWIVRRWAAGLVAAAALGLACAFALVTLQVWNGEIAERPAVVVVPEVRAASGPSDDAQQILLLHDGTEVRIREARGEYLLVQLPGGAGGWVARNAVERVF